MIERKVVMRRLVTVICVFGTILISGSIIASASRPEQTVAPPTFLASVVQREAANMGDPLPSATGFVETTRQAAEDASHGGKVDSNTAVYYVVLHGHFVDSKAFLPAGANSPVGNEIDFTIDKATGEILDFGIGNGTPALSRLGAVFPVPGMPGGL